MTVSESEFAHEREGLTHVRELLPDRRPYRAWANFEFRDSDGKWHEVDLLVLGQARLHLVELKHYRGLLRGTAYRWQRGGRSIDSPLLLARRKAQRLKGVITDALRELQPDLDPRSVPYIQESVFLHARDGRCGLPVADCTDLFGLDGHPGSNLPSIMDRLLEPPDPRRQPGLVQQDDLLALLFEKIGFAVRRERVVGSWRLLGPPEAEGEGWQDWPAEHHAIQRDRARIRFFVTPPGSSDAQRQGTRRLVEREYELTSRLHHDGLLRPLDFVDDELGPGLVFPTDDGAQRLDLWLADHPEALSLAAQVGVIRQLAEALAYAHRHHIVHRGLAPRSVFVTDSEGETPALRIGDWQLAGRDTASIDTRSPATRLFRAMEGRQDQDDAQRRAELFLAPEGRWNPYVDRVRLDVFALGAVAYALVSGRPPGSDAGDVRDRLQRDGGLDLAADVPEVPASLRHLVLKATSPVVSERLSDMQAFLAELDKVDRAVSAPPTDPDGDPLDVPPGTVLGGRFELVRRLGSGSTAVGLLVKDATDGEHRVLKVASDDAAARRLTDEAAVLRTLGTTAYPRIVRLAAPEPVRVGSRTALLLESAGEETLADALRDRSRLSLDLLERWGTDLLAAVVTLDRAGVDHRDIKPSNLGVREQRSDRAKHLVLFDFSLARAGAGSTQAGTPPYLDPFIGTGRRPTWDSAAERYAVAVTLFEMATGTTPRYGDGSTAPDVIGDEASVDAGAFDPAVASSLAQFFRRALRRVARDRYDTATEMLDGWRAAFTQAGTTVPADADALAAAASFQTPLADAGLSPRALSAIEPLAVSTVADLAAVDPGRLSSLRGAAAPTRLEVRSRAKQWRERFAAELATTITVVVGDPGGTVLQDPELAALLLVDRAGPVRAKARTRLVRMVLGMDGETAGAADEPDGVEPFGSAAALAAASGITNALQTHRTLGEALAEWAADPESRRTLDDVLTLVVEGVDAAGGLARPGDVVPAELPAGQRRVALGLVRLALDRADQVERGGGDPAPVLRRRRGQHRAVVLGTATELLDAADSLGETADTLVASAVATGDRVVPAAQAALALRETWPKDILVPDDVRLARLAARLSSTAGTSRRGELHHRDLSPADALRVALGGLAPSQTVSPSDLLERVRARFPDLARLPGRPRLDQLVVDAGLDLRWDGAAYAVPSRPSDTASWATRTSATSIAVTAGVPAEKGTWGEDALAESVRARSFLALGVRASRVDSQARRLTAVYGAVVVDVTEVLLGALRFEAERVGLPWAEVRAADAAAAGSRPAQGLARLVERAAPAVEAAVAQAAAAAAEGTRPVLLTEAAPLARYGRTEVVARLADITTARRQAVWLLLPLDGDRGATLDGAPLPLAHGGQFLRLEDQPLATDTLSMSVGTATTGDIP